MTQTTGLLQKGAEIASQAATAHYKTIVAAVPNDSPLRPFFSPALGTWIDEQLKAQKPLDLLSAYRRAEMNADAKAQENSRLIKERDHLKERLDDVGGRLLALEQGRNLGIIRVKDGTTTYLLEECDSEVTSDLNNSAWRGVLTFTLYSPVVDNAAFQRVMEVLFRNGFDGRIVGKPLMLHGVSIKRYITKEEQQAHRMATGIVRVEYTAIRTPARGDMLVIDGGYEIKAAL